MSIDQKIVGDIGKLFLSEEIDLDKSPEVRENIKELFDQVKTVEVQLSKVTYIDSSGIAALIEGMQVAKNNSKEFYLTDVSNEVMKVIKLAHLDKFFKIKNVTGVDAGGTAIEEPTPEPEVEANENVDLNSNDNNEQSNEQPQESTNKNEVEQTEPSIKRDDDGGDKIKFKR